MSASTQNRHPDHDRLCDEVRSWYRTSMPDLGYSVERRRFGFYRRRAHPVSSLIVLETATPKDVPEFVADAHGYFSHRPIEIWIEDPDLDATLGPTLITAGCSRAAANVSLAHVGSCPELVPLPSDVVVEPVTSATLVDYALVKLKGFANSEAEPTPERLQEELAVRASEIASIGRLLVARVRGEPATILGYYDGPDRSIFNLATRIPFRNRGMAKHLLCRVLADSYDRDCSSVIIGTDPADTPIQLYRRLGFIDQVYWRSTYLVT
jgi:ribosomal protein S18 acetylase RimI-like enzyme